MLDDDRLIDEALAGNSASFGCLVTKHQDRLYNALVHVTGSAEDARDLVQDAFVQAFIKLATFQRTSAFYTWRQELAGDGGVAPAEEQAPSPAKSEPSEKPGAADGVGGVFRRDQKSAAGLRPNELGTTAGARRSRTAKKGPRQLLPTARYRAVFVFNEVPPSDVPISSPPPAAAQLGNP